MVLTAQNSDSPRFGLWLCHSLAVNSAVKQVMSFFPYSLNIQQLFTKHLCVSQWQKLKTESCNKADKTHAFHTGYESTGREESKQGHVKSESN